MKNITLIVPKLEDYYYEQKLNEDPSTMSYNADYDLPLKGYHYDTGCIDFPKTAWKEKYQKRITENRYFAYIKDCTLDKYVGTVNYQYNKENGHYECGIIIEKTYRHQGYAKDALRLLMKAANHNHIKYLYDNFELDREDALKVFTSLGFVIDKKTTWKKFGAYTTEIILKGNTANYQTNIENIKTIEDVFMYMKNNIRYGWLDINACLHIGSMKEFRRLYQTMTIKEILDTGVGTCIDQVKLMNYLLDKINIPNKMFCTRIYEPNDFANLEAEEHMHCFILCYQDNKVYHIEHPNWYNLGIHEYKDEPTAINTINEYYVELSGGVSRPLTEFYEIKDHLSFKEFNNYINSL